MEDSWQKLMGIDCVSLNGSSSPVFHKKKWILPKPLENSESGLLLSRSQEPKSRNDAEFPEIRLKKLNFDEPAQLENITNNNNTSTINEVDDALLVSTPTKPHKQKRKRVDLLNCSVRSEHTLCKKTKNNSENSLLSKDSHLEGQLELDVNQPSPKPTLSLLTSTKNSLLSLENVNPSHKPVSSSIKPQRKLLYSSNKMSDSNIKTQKLTVNDVCKSTIMIDEADIRSSPKKERRIGFVSESNEFQTVTALDNLNQSNGTLIAYDLPTDTSICDPLNSDDSFRNCMFTEIEKECSTVKQDSSVAINGIKPPINNLPVPSDTNLMDESFINCRFTEIEEGYNCLKQVEFKVEDLDMNDQGHCKNDYLSLLEANDELNLSGQNSAKSILPEKYLMERRTVENKGCHFSPTVKNVDKVDSVMIDEIKFTHLKGPHSKENHYMEKDELNPSLRGEEVGQDLLNKSVSKLSPNTSLTEIMSQLVNKNKRNPPKPKLRESSGRNIISNATQSNMSKKNTETNGNSSLSHLPELPSPESSNLFIGPDSIQHHSGNNDSLLCYQQSFDYIISAHAKSLSSNKNNEITPEKKPLVLEKTSSSDNFVNGDAKFVDNKEYASNDLNSEGNQIKDDISNVSSTPSDLFKSCHTTKEDERPESESESKKTVGSNFEQNSDYSFEVTWPKMFTKTKVDQSDLKPAFGENSNNGRGNILYYKPSFNKKTGGYNDKDEFIPKNLQKADSLVKNEQVDWNADSNKRSFKTDGFLFLTAGGKSINVSEDSFKKVKLAYKDLLEDPIEPTKINDFLGENKTNISSSNNGNTLHTQLSQLSRPVHNKNMQNKKSIERDCRAFNTNLEKVLSLNDESKEQIKSKNNDLLDHDRSRDQELKLGTKASFLPSNRNIITKTEQYNIKRPFMDSNVDPSVSMNVDDNILRKQGPTDINSLIVFKKPSTHPIKNQVPSSNSMFSTALGKKVHVTNESLKKIRSIFKDDLDCDLSNESSISKPGTNSNHFKNVFVSSTPNATSSSLPIDECKLRKEILDFSGTPGAPLKKGISDSKTELNSSCDLYPVASTSEETFRQNTNESNEIDLSIKSNCQTTSFSTAGGRHISVSEDILAKVKLKFNDVLDGANDYHTSCNSSYSRSSTSKSKTFNLPGVAILTNPQSTDESIKLPKNQCLKESARSTDNLMCLSGGKYVVSETTLVEPKSKSHQMVERLSSLDTKDTKISSDNQSPKNESMNPKTERFTFSTASGKNISVSESDLALVKSKFSELLKLDDQPFVKIKDEQIDNDQLLEKPSQNVTTNEGFQLFTADTNNVGRSSRGHVKSKFDELLEHDQSVVETKGRNHLFVTPQSTSTAELFMFSTAGGKKISVSENALVQVKSRFSELLEDDPSLVKMQAELVGSGQLPKHPYRETIPGQHINFSCASTKNGKESQGTPQIVNSKLFSKLASSSYSNLGDSEGNIKKSSDVLTLMKQGEGFRFTNALGKNINAFNDSTGEEKLLFNQLENPLSQQISSHLSKNPSISSKNSDIIVSLDASKNLETKESKSTEKAKFILGLGKSFPCFDNANKKMNDRLLENRLYSNQNDQSSSALMSPGSTDVNLSKDVFANVNSTFDDELKNIPFALGTTDLKNVYNHMARNSFHPKQNIHMIEGFPFSNALGKTISVCEEALAKAKLKFNYILENSFTDLDNTDSYLENNPLPENTFDLKPGEEKIKGSKLAPTYNVQLKNVDFNFSNAVDMEDLQCKMGFKNADQIHKKIKSSHLGSSNIMQQPDKNKTCFNSQEVNNQDKLRESQLPTGSFSFTQSISQSVLDKEIGTIEQKTFLNGSANAEKNESKEEKSDMGCKNFLSKDTEIVFGTQESDMSMICEVSDSAAAFIADCTPERSILSSPSSFFNRGKLKPMNLFNIEFEDVDEEDMVAAESEVVPTVTVNIPSEKSESESVTQFRSCPSEFLAIRNMQRVQADKIIKDKLKNRPKASPGLYVSLKSKSKLTAIGDCPFNKPMSNLTKEQLILHGLLEDIINVTSASASDFKFCAEHFFRYEECLSGKGIIDIGNGFSMILSDDNKIGLDEFNRSFMLCAHVDPSLVTPGWVKNHFRWIVWKLASYEKLFPHIVSRRFLTPENVLHQLKYRYDREIDLAQRSAFKRILECDEPSSKRFIACVADIRKVNLEEGESSFEIELTDGWYSVWTLIDPAMINLIKQQKVKIGTKLISHATELFNCTDGCDPLELTDSIRMKLHTNCTRRTKWNLKMGFTRCPGPICVSLSSIIHNGGFIGLTSAIVARSYPLLFMSKDADGKTVIRNAQAESHANNLKQNDLTLKSEELFEKLLPEVESKYRAGTKVIFDRNNIKQIKDPEVLWMIISNESDPCEIQNSMTSTQLLEVKKYHEIISSKIKEEVQALVKQKLQDLMPSQKHKSLLKLRLVDPLSNFSALLTVWNPSEDLCQLLVENKCFDFYGLNASGIRDKVLQLSNTKNTIYNESKVFKTSQKYERRVMTISDIVSGIVSVHFGELDVVGIVIYIKEPEKPWGVTNVYLSDTLENFLMITFWTSLKAFGCEDIMKPGSIVACINLQWRNGSGSYVIPSTYANEMTCFSTNSNQEYLSKEFQTIKTTLSSESVDDFIIRRRRRLLTILKEREYVSKMTPVRSVDTPKVLKRLENLKRYGEASPLPNITLMSSPHVYKKFVSPKSGKS